MIKHRDKRSTEIPLAFCETNKYGPPYWPTVTFGFSMHFEKAEKPAGGNAMYGDGHAEWRTFAHMIKVVNYPDQFERYY